MAKKYIFKVNPEKATAKVTINSIIMGGLFFILTLLISLKPDKFNLLLLGQLVLAIPLLFVATLAYAKIGYWNDTKSWDALGWFTNTIGNAFVFNSVGLMTAQIDKSIALLYFLISIILMIIYSIINVQETPDLGKQKLFKFFFFFILTILGGAIPALFI
jgi:hypothetical protein